MLRLIQICNTQLDDNSNLTIMTCFAFGMYQFSRLYFPILGGHAVVPTVFYESVSPYITSCHLVRAPHSMQFPSAAIQEKE